MILEANIGEKTKYVFILEIDIESHILEIFSTWRYVNPQLFFRNVYSIAKISITHTIILDIYTVNQNWNPFKNLLTLDHIPIHRWDLDNHVHRRISNFLWCNDQRHIGICQLHIDALHKRLRHFRHRNLKKQVKIVKMQYVKLISLIFKNVVKLSWVTVVFDSFKSFL